MKAAILKRLLTTVLFILCVPVVLVIAYALGIWAIWTKPKEKREGLKPAGEAKPTNPSITAPINWNRVPLGREDKGGTC